MPRTFAGPVAWAAHFIAIYGVTAIACERGAPGVVLPAIAGLTILATGVVVWALRGWPRGTARPLLAWLGPASAALALAAILAQAAPALVVPACG
jgi:hypothetical protein